MSSIKFPIRINKYLAHKGHTTRRGADALIVKGLVYINDSKAVLGDIVKESDNVEVRKTFASPKETFYYVAYNKPRGIKTTSHIKPGGTEEETNTLDSIEYRNTRLVPMGRLDKNTSGLMIFSNDGRITDRLLNPKYAHEREYEVRVDKKYSPGFIQAMQNGIQLDDGMTKPAQVEPLSPDSFRIIMTESRNHQIQKMCDCFNMAVTDSKRTRIINITLAGVPEGDYRELTPEQKEYFLTSIGLGR